MMGHDEGNRYAGRAICSRRSNTPHESHDWNTVPSEHHHHSPYYARSTQAERLAQSSVKRKAADDDDERGIFIHSYILI